MDIAKVREFLAAREEDRKVALHSRWLRARSDFDRIVARIVEDYEPVRVYQWGSLIDIDRFSEISDIDIAVEGITDAQTYQALLGDVMDMTEFPLDIVRMEHVTPEVASLIRNYGRIVYERTDS